LFSLPTRSPVAGGRTPSGSRSSVACDGCQLTPASAMRHAAPLHGRWEGVGRHGQLPVDAARRLVNECDGYGQTPVTLLPLVESRAHRSESASCSTIECVSRTERAAFAFCPSSSSVDRSKLNGLQILCFLAASKNEDNVLHGILRSSVG
jgi:hypothetical protein